jgi:hypothetical protein
MEMLRIAAALAAAALLAALLVQPFRLLAGRVWRGLALALLPLGMMAQGLAAAAVIDARLPWPPLLALYALCAAPPALVAALLLARPLPEGLNPALAALGMAPLARARLALAQAMPGLLLGWLLALMPGLGMLALTHDLFP